MGGRIELWGKDSKDDISFELKEDSDCLGKKAGRDFYGTFFALKNGDEKLRGTRQCLS